MTEEGKLGARVSSGDPLLEPLADLRRVSSRLRRIGYMLLLTTVIEIVTAFLCAIPFVRIIKYVILDVSICAACLTIILAAWFEGSRRHGGYIFEEISEELQVRVRDKSADESSRRPQIGERLALRDFTGSVDLPIVPGKYGPGLYVLTNILSVMIVAAQINLNSYWG